MFNSFSEERLSKFIGAGVSVDVSTCDEDAAHRVFGTIVAVQDGILLAVEDSRNFETPSKPQLSDEEIDVIAQRYSTSGDVMSDKKTIESKEFYELMQTYRHTNHIYVDDVVLAYQAVIDYIDKALNSQQDIKE